MISAPAKSWPLIVITFVIFIFFIKLFIPHQAIFVTPDYGRSDAWHLSIANKYYYAQELKKNRLPIWNPAVGTGFPTLAEGQTGIFFIPNLILFRSLPFVLAYNLNLVLAFILAAFGVYLFCRSLNLNKFASLYGGIIFALGGFFMVHIPHLHLIQTAAMLPWLFWAANEFLNNQKVLYLLFLSLILSQQIFAGFPQITAYGLFSLSIYVILQNFFKNKKGLKSFMIINLSIILGLLIATIQIAPTYELLKVSNRHNDPQLILNQFPYKVKNLLQFLNPSILGSPKDGTYPRWVPGQWGIYWESIAYIGIIPLALSAASTVLLYFKKTRDKKTIVIFASLATLSILLSLGSSAPFHPLFSFPPFSIFRVPSRFLIITQFSLCVLAAIYINKITRRRFLYFLVLIISIANLFFVFKNYNPVGRAPDWFASPETAKYLKSQNPGRIYTFGQFTKWTEHFLSRGWKDPGYYYFARNSLDQNSNLIFNLSQVLSYESLPTQRSSIFAASISSAFKREDSGYSATANLANFLAAAGVSHVISTENIESGDFRKVFETAETENTSFKIYKLAKDPSRLFVTDQLKTAKTVPQITKTIENREFDPKNQAIVEMDSNPPVLKLRSWQAKIVEETPTKVKIAARLDGNGFLILSDSFSPGWSAKVNGAKAKIYPANINSRAVFLDNGENKIIFEYKPKSLYYFLPISIISLALTLVSIFKFSKAKII